MNTQTYWQQKKRVRKGLSATLDAIAQHLEERTGRRPSDEQAAAALAISITHIRRARAKAGSSQ